MKGWHHYLTLQEGQCGEMSAFLKYTVLGWVPWTDVLKGSLLRTAVRCGTCEGMEKAGCGRDKNYNAVTSEPQPIPQGAMGPGQPCEGAHIDALEHGLWTRHPSISR